LLSIFYIGFLSNEWLFFGCIKIRPKGCIRKIIVKGLRVFINFSLSNPENISGDKIRCPILW
jgi:hypothetical protein